MMRRLLMTRSVGVLMLALATGLFSAWAASRHIQGKVALLEARARQPEVERIVAAVDLPVGTRIDSSHLALRAYPAGLASSDSLPGTQWQRIEGSVLRSPLVAGDLIVPAHVRAPDRSAFSTRLLAGRRAITMPVDIINSVSGLLEPGDLIDLYVSFEYRRRHITAPLLQGVLVLATGTSTQEQVQARAAELRPAAPTHTYTSVTLDVAPEDAVKLVAARETGRITAVLRPPHDGQASNKASRGDLATLLGLNPSTLPVSPRKIPVLYGNKAIASVPRLRAPPPGTRQPSGVFDLPYTPGLSHATRVIEE